jgi:DNA repair photolyase
LVTAEHYPSPVVVALTTGETCAPAPEAPTRGLTNLFEPICGTMWSVTPYRLCDHRCVYCCTGVQGPSTPIVGADEAVRVARRFVADAGPDASPLLLLGAFADAYPGVEAEHGLTRTLLRELVALDARIVIITKGDTVLRDVDLLLAAASAKVQVSISSTDDELLARIDGSAPTATRRFEVVDALLDAGVDVEVNALPWIPDVTDTEALLERIPEPVAVTFSPLSFGDGRDRRTFLGRTYTRDEVWEAYLAAYRQHGHIARASWVRPTPPPQENHPLLRLPTLPRAGRA